VYTKCKPDLTRYTLRRNTVSTEYNIYWDDNTKPSEPFIVFQSLAINTREQYLRDLAQNYNNQEANDSSRSFSRFSITSKRLRDNKDKQKPKLLPEKLSLGGLTWNVLVNDFRWVDTVFLKWTIRYFSVIKMLQNSRILMQMFQWRNSFSRCDP